MGAWTGLIWLRVGASADSCEHALPRILSKPSVYLKCGNSLAS
jgi:hypothetical protein